MREVPPAGERAFLEKWQPALRRRNGLDMLQRPLPIFWRRCPFHHCRLDEAEESEEGELHCPVGGEWLGEWDVVKRGK